MVSAPHTFRFDLVPLREGLSTCSLVHPSVLPLVHPSVGWSVRPLCVFQNTQKHMFLTSETQWGDERGLETGGGVDVGGQGIQYILRYPKGLKT